VYDQPTLYGGLPLLVATFFFTFQIYCDFSGYSYIAIGAAEVMGFRTMDNFNYPYLSTSVAEFWRRWHISLSSWFRDYLYFPLGGNRVSAPRRYFNILVVLLLCGLWHGANWTFVVWGGIHGLYLVAALVTRGLRDRIHEAIGLGRLPRVYKGLKVLTTFLLVCFAWIFFRANHLSDALYIVAHLFVGWGSAADQGDIRSAPVSMNLRFEFAVAIGSILFLIGIALLHRRGDVWQRLAAKPLWIRWSVYMADRRLLVTGQFSVRPIHLFSVLEGNDEKVLANLFLFSSLPARPVRGAVHLACDVLPSDLKPSVCASFGVSCPVNFTPTERSLKSKREIWPTTRLMP
jgi:hypothetical protein